MRRSRVVRLVLVVIVIAAAVDLWRRPRDVDAAALPQDSAGPVLRVTIIGNATDARAGLAREALAFWNREFGRLGRRVHFDSATVRSDSIPDDLLREASGEAMMGFGPAISRLLDAFHPATGDIVIALSNTDLISFSVRWREGSRGVAGIRRSDIPPLSFPNTARNVIAHELGHVLGLEHNSDSTTLMCGRPAPCRPAAFRSDSARFFPLTTADDRRIQGRWP